VHSSAPHALPARALAPRTTQGRLSVLCRMSGEWCRLGGCSPKGTRRGRRHCVLASCHGNIVRVFHMQPTTTYTSSAKPTHMYNQVDNLVCKRNAVQRKGGMHPLCHLTVSNIVHQLGSLHSRPMRPRSQHSCHNQRSTKINFCCPANIYPPETIMVTQNTAAVVEAGRSCIHFTCMSR